MNKYSSRLTVYDNLSGTVDNVFNVAINPTSTDEQLTSVAVAINSLTTGTVQYFKVVDNSSLGVTPNAVQSPQASPANVYSAPIDTVQQNLQNPTTVQGGR